MKTVIYSNYNLFLEDCKKLKKDDKDLRMIFRNDNITPRKLIRLTNNLYADIIVCLGKDFIMIENVKSYSPNKIEIINMDFLTFLHANKIGYVK